jgi:hypothetical protein
MNSVRPLKLITWLQLSIVLVFGVFAINMTHKVDQAAIALSAPGREPGVGMRVNATNSNMYQLEESRKRELARGVRSVTNEFTFWIAAAMLLMFGGPIAAFLYVASRMPADLSAKAEDSADATLGWQLHVM